MKAALKVFTFVCAVLCIACIILQGMTSVGDTAIDITREYHYSSQEQADANPLPETVEDNGNIYVLDPESVSYEQKELNTRYEETVDFSDLETKEVPDTYTVKLGEESCDMPLVDVSYTENTVEPVQMTVEYKGEDSEPDAPDKKTFTLEDGTEAEGTLKGIEKKDDDTWVDFTIDGTVVIPEGATLYMYMNKIHAYDPATPLWPGYQADLLSSLNLSSKRYKINTGKWSGSPVARAEGGFTRNVTFYGKKNTGASYVATYEVTPAKTTYTAKATYGVSLLDVGIDESFGNTSELTICAIAHYILQEVAEAGAIIGNIYRNRMLMPIMACIFGILSVACAIAGFTKVKEPEGTEA